MTFLLLGVRFALGLVFVTAGVSKIGRVEEAAAAVRRYELLPERLAALVGRGLPWLELSGGLLLVGGVALQVVSLLAAVLLVVFAAAIGWNLLRGRRIDCGCGAVGLDQQISWPMVVRNVVLAVGAVGVAFGASGPPLVPGAAVGVVAVGEAVGVLLVVSLGVVATRLTVEAGRFHRLSTRVGGVTSKMPS